MNYQGRGFSLKSDDGDVIVDVDFVPDVGLGD